METKIYFVKISLWGLLSASFFLTVLAKDITSLSHL